MRKGSYLLLVFLCTVLCVAYGALNFSDFPRARMIDFSPAHLIDASDSLSDNAWECQICRHSNPNWKHFCEVCWN